MLVKVQVVFFSDMLTLQESTFTQLAISSIDAVRFCSTIQNRFGVHLPARVLYDPSKCIGDIANIVDEAMSDPNSGSLFTSKEEYEGDLALDPSIQPQG